MRAVCTRSGRRGTAMGVCAHEEGLCRSRGGSRVPLLFFSPRDGGKNTSSREEALLFRREDPFSTLRQSFFCLVSFFFSFFQTDHPLFWTARHPTGKGWKPRGERGRNRSSFCTAEILSQTRYYFSLLSCVHFAVLLLQSCNHARCKAD